MFWQSSVKINQCSILIRRPAFYKVLSCKGMYLYKNTVIIFIHLMTTRTKFISAQCTFLEVSCTDLTKEMISPRLCYLLPTRFQLRPISCAVDGRRVIVVLMIRALHRLFHWEAATPTNECLYTFLLINIRETSSFEQIVCGHVYGRLLVVSCHSPSLWRSFNHRPSASHNTMFIPNSIWNACGNCGISSAYVPLSQY